MANVHDVAAYVLEKHGTPMSTWKLQKLVYYAQAWHLAWEEEPLFEEDIEAWANGPVVRELYNHHRGRFMESEWNLGRPERLTPAERETIEAVVAEYGKLSGRQLSHLSHNERPWLEAREGLASTEPSTRKISLDTMQQFYAALDADTNARPVASLPWAQLGLF